MAAITGRMTVDADGDNTEAASGGGFDSGIEGFVVELLDANGVVIATALTDAWGIYSFDGLAVGDYRIRFPTSVGSRVLATPDVGSFDNDSDANQTTGETITISITSLGQTVPEVDASYGFYSGGAVDGTDSTQSMEVGFTDHNGNQISHGNDTIFGNAGDDTIRSGDGSDVVEGDTGNDFVDGQVGDDTIYGGAGHDVLRGGDGNDDMFGGVGDDDMLGGVGADDMFGGAGNDFMGGQDGDDTLDGGAGADFVAGDDGNDLVQGGDGNDTLVGGAGADTLVGGAGNDLFTADNGFVTTDDPTADAAGDVVFGGAEGASDTDILDLRGADVVQIVREHDPNDAGAVRGVVTFSNGHTLTFEGIELILTDAVDGLETGESMQVGYTDPEGDAITESADTILGNGGHDTIGAGGGNDIVDGGSGHDNIDGGTGGDTITGGTGDDVLFGVDGNDSISGGDGADYVDGGAGADTLSGGAGNDLIVGDINADSLSGDDGDDFVGGGADNDTVSGGAGNDTVAGDTGDDNLSGDAGNDLLLGGAGDDTLSGGEGDDFIEGAAGNDLLTGGQGNDFFDYTIGEGLDTITDFNAGNTGTLDDGDDTNNDFIDLSGYYDHISELYADQADDGILNQSNTTDTRGNTIDYSDNTQFDTNGTPNDEGIQFTGANADSSFFTAENTGVVCFTSGTKIATPKGEVPIETLVPGDFVLTRDNGPQPLVWIGKRHVGPAELAQNRKLRPIEIKPTLIQSHTPLIVSRQHGVLLRVDGEETLVRAIHLAKLPRSGARIMHGRRSVTYFHLMFEAHQIIFAEGAPSESFHPGPQALGSLIASAREELLYLFPALPSKLARVVASFNRLCASSLHAA